MIDPATHYPTEISGSPFGTGSGPQCMLEDPSNQFIYTANFNDSTVTGRVVDQNSGVLNDLRDSAKSLPAGGSSGMVHCYGTHELVNPKAFGQD